MKNINIDKVIEYAKNNVKQVIVGAVILVVAIILMFTAFSTNKKTTKQEPVKVVVQKTEPAKPEKKLEDLFINFTADAKTDFQYQIFYTVKDEIWYDPEHVLTFNGKAGKENYKILIPAEKVYRIRIDFDAENEEIIVRDVFLSGAQKTDLNDFENYIFNDIAKHTINEDGSITVITNGVDPHMGYYIK